MTKERVVDAQVTLRCHPISLDVGRLATQSPILLQNSPAMPWSFEGLQATGRAKAVADGGQQVALRGDGEQFTQGRHLGGAQAGVRTRTHFLPGPRS